MKFAFKIKTKPLCVTAVLGACYIAIIVIEATNILYGGGRDPYSNWYPVTLATFILFISISYIAKN
jgi:hypothetical protein